MADCSTVLLFSHTLYSYTHLLPFLKYGCSAIILNYLKLNCNLFQEVVEKNVRLAQNKKRDDAESMGNDSVVSTSSNLEPFASDDLGIVIHTKPVFNLHLGCHLLSLSNQSCQLTSLAMFPLMQ